MERTQHKIKVEDFIDSKSLITVKVEGDSSLKEDTCEPMGYAIKESWI